MLQLTSRILSFDESDFANELFAWIVFQRTDLFL